MVKSYYLKNIDNIFDIIDQNAFWEMYLMDKIVYKFDTSKKNKSFLSHGLELYNFSKNKWLNPAIYKTKQKCFGFYAYDAHKIIGGAYGFVDDGYWLFIDLLFVEEKYRNNDIATNLMEKIEKFAKQNNCIGIRTDTWSFQARGFYEKMGFSLYGQLENNPPYAVDYLLKKVLITDEKEFPQPL